MSTLTHILNQLQKSLGDWQLKQISQLCLQHKPLEQVSYLQTLVLKSESFGLPATADFMFALISNEELDELNQIAVKQLKNRYNDPTMNKRFVVGIDRAKMRLFDVSMDQQNIVDSNQTTEEDTFAEPVFDRTNFGEGLDSFKV